MHTLVSILKLYFWWFHYPVLVLEAFWFVYVTDRRHTMRLRKDSPSTWKTVNNDLYEFHRYYLHRRFELLRVFAADPNVGIFEIASKHVEALCGPETPSMEYVPMYKLSDRLHGCRVRAQACYEITKSWIEGCDARVEEGRAMSEMWDVEMFVFSMHELQEAYYWCEAAHTLCERARALKLMYA